MTTGEVGRGRISEDPPSNGIVLILLASLSASAFGVLWWASVGGEGALARSLPWLLGK